MSVLLPNSEVDGSSTLNILLLLRYHLLLVFRVAYRTILGTVLERIQLRLQLYISTKQVKKGPQTNEASYHPKVYPQALQYPQSQWEIQRQHLSSALSRSAKISFLLFAMPTNFRQKMLVDSRVHWFLVEVSLLSCEHESRPPEIQSQNT